MEAEVELLRKRQAELEQLELELAIQEEEALLGELLALEFLERTALPHDTSKNQLICCLSA